MLINEDIRETVIELAKNDVRLQSTMVAFNENMRSINENLHSIVPSERVWLDEQ